MHYYLDNVTGDLAAYDRAHNLTGSDLHDALVNLLDAIEHADPHALAEYLGDRAAPDRLAAGRDVLLDDLRRDALDELVRHGCFYRGGAADRLIDALDAPSHGQ